MCILGNRSIDDVLVDIVAIVIAAGGATGSSSSS